MQSHRPNVHLARGCRVPLLIVAAPRAITGSSVITRSVISRNGSRVSVRGHTQHRVVQHAARSRRRPPSPHPLQISSPGGGSRVCSCGVSVKLERFRVIAIPMLGRAATPCDGQCASEHRPAVARLATVRRGWRLLRRLSVPHIWTLQSLRDVKRRQQSQEVRGEGVIDVHSQRQQP